MAIATDRTGLADYLRSHEHRGGIIVCEERGFVYMKAAKTAGTSILRAGLERRLPGIVHLKDHPVAFQRWLDTITDRALERYFIFSVVRNPWDRLVSVAAHFGIPPQALANDIERYRRQESVRVHSVPLHLYTHLNGVPFVDMICRFERLQADMDVCFDRIGLPREKLAFVNRTRHEHYSTYYGEREIAAVGSFYRQDVEYFGYSF